MAKYFDSERVTPAFFKFFSESRRYNSVAIALSAGQISMLDSKAEHATAHLSMSKRHGKELLFVSIVDNFQCYLTELLAAIYDVKPQLLSNKSTQNEIIFQFDDISELKKFIVSRAVLGLGYKSIDDLDEYFKSFLKFSLIETKFQKHRLNRFIQIRNIITHNRGKINHQFVSKCGAKHDRVGDDVIIPYLNSVDKYLISLASQIDGRAIEKFDIHYLGKK